MEFSSNKTTQAIVLVALFLCVAVWTSCKKEESAVLPGNDLVPVLPQFPYNYEDINFPASFGYTPLANFLNIPSDNPVTNYGATLGRVLFYDKNLSASRTVSCSSCHKQEHGFSDPSALSKGHHGGQTRRNSSHLVNLQYHTRMFWDRRADNLEQQVLMPIQDSVEMGMSLPALVDRLTNIGYYSELFMDAFGDNQITPDRISKALAQFLRSIVSYHSKFDEGWPEFNNYTEEELLGREIFMSAEGGCSFCHMPVSFHNPQAMNNGLDEVYTDNGVGEISGNPGDNGKFKVPSLRNAEVSAPYMHDGRFQTLEEVIEHYNSGVKQHPNLDDRLTYEQLTGGTPKPLNLTPAKKQALLAFMKTLTDYSVLNDPKFSDPFQPVH